MASTHAPTTAPADLGQVRRVLPGLGVALVIAGLATGLGKLAPVVGGPVFGIVLGVVVSTLVPGLRQPRWTPGYVLAARTVLQLSIVVLGGGLSLQQVVRVGGESLPVMLGTIAVALGGAWALGRMLKVDGDTRTLIGVGTGICGASAIAACTAVTRSKDTDVAYAIGTIFTFNIVAVLAFPPVGHLLGMSAHAFGLWSGTAINDTSSVVAAAYAYSDDAGQYAIVVKLTRSLMIIPIVVVLAVLRARRNRTDIGSMPWRRIVPPFLIGFVLAAGLDSAGLIPDAWHPALAALGTFLITTALAGIGLSLRLSDIRRAGHRPLALGALLWIAVAATGIGLQAVTAIH